MRKTSNSLPIKLAAVVLVAFSLACPALRIPSPEPTAYCQWPSPAEAASFELYVLSTLATDREGAPLDLAPGYPLPEGATEAESPELYEGRAWAQGIVCRVCPALCVE